jgi:hypothetical protein
MPSPFIFKDKTGTEWDLEITLATAKRIDQADFTNVTDKKIVFIAPDKEFFGEMIQNTPLVCAISAVILIPQMKEKLSLDYNPMANWEEAEQAFQSRLNGKAILDLKTAYIGALQDFFPEQKTVLSTLTTQYSRALEKMGLLMEKASPKIEEVVDLEMQQAETNFLSLIEKEKQRVGDELTRSSQPSIGDQETNLVSPSVDS